MELKEADGEVVRANKKEAGYLERVGEQGAEEEIEREWKSGKQQERWRAVAVLRPPE